MKKHTKPLEPIGNFIEELIIAAEHFDRLHGKLSSVDYSEHHSRLHWAIVRMRQKMSRESI
jgi:hypothetical protein